MNFQVTNRVWDNSRERYEPVVIEFSFGIFGEVTVDTADYVNNYFTSFEMTKDEFERMILAYQEANKK